jgi:tRNA pseudouridine-54 N-methylase
LNTNVHIVCCRLLRKQLRELNREKVVLEQTYKALEEDFNLNYEKQRVQVESCLSWEKENGERLLNEIEKNVKALNEMELQFQLFEKEQNHVNELMRKKTKKHSFYYISSSNKFVI